MNEVKKIECKQDFVISADGEIELTINNFVSFNKTAWAHSP